MTRRRRFGRIRKLPSGRFQVRYPAPDGRDIPAPQTFATKTDADRFLSQIETDVARGTWVDHRLGKETIRDWSARYMATTTHLKPKTRASYASLRSAVILPELGDVPVGQLRPIAVREWVSHLVAAGLSPSRVGQAYRLLAQMMAAAETSGLIAVTPCRGVSLPSMPKTEPKIVTEKQALAIASAAREPYDVLVLTLAYTGVRIGEVFALRRSSVDVLNGRLIVDRSLSDANGHLSFETTKNHQQRNITLPAFLAQRIEDHLQGHVADDPNALLFTSPDGAQLRYPNFMRRTWKPAVAKAGLTGVTPHSLRASHGSWIVDTGGSVLDAAARLGHSSASVTTRHYARAVKGRDAEIAARFEAGVGAGFETDRARSGHGKESRSVRVAP